MMDHIPLSLSLLPPTSTLNTNVDYRLEITNADNEVIKVEYPIANNKQLVRQYSLTEARFILEYPFERRYPFNDSTRWRITVISGVGRPPEHIHHDFANREAAFQFQTAITGYVPFGYLDDAFCSATWSRFLKNEVYGGQGEVQLWCPISLWEERAGPSNSSVSVATSPTAGLAPTHDSRKNRTSIVDQNLSPLLVALLLDDDGKKYTMMKAKGENKSPRSVGFKPRANFIQWPISSPSQLRECQIGSHSKPTRDSQCGSYPQTEKIAATGTSAVFWAPSASKRKKLSTLLSLRRGQQTMTLQGSWTNFSSGLATFARCTWNHWSGRTGSEAPSLGEWEAAACRWNASRSAQTTPDRRLHQPSPQTALHYPWSALLHHLGNQA